MLRLFAANMLFFLAMVLCAYGVFLLNGIGPHDMKAWMALTIGILSGVIAWNILIHTDTRH